jgi:hypothetical protein
VPRPVARIGGRGGPSSGVTFVPYAKDVRLISASIFWPNVFNGQKICDCAITQMTAVSGKRRRLVRVQVGEVAFVNQKT